MDTEKNNGGKQPDGSWICPVCNDPKCGASRPAMTDRDELRKLRPAAPDLENLTAGEAIDRMLAKGYLSEDPVGCGCDEFPECVHSLYWYMGFKAAQPAAAPRLYTIKGVEDSTLCVDHLEMGRKEMNSDLADGDTAFAPSDWIATEHGECFICRDNVVIPPR